MKVSVQESVGFLRFSNFKKFAKQKEKPAQMPVFWCFFTGGRLLALIEQKIKNIFSI